MKKNISDWCKIETPRSVTSNQKLSVSLKMLVDPPKAWSVFCGLHWHRSNGNWGGVVTKDTTPKQIRKGETKTFEFAEISIPQDAAYLMVRAFISCDGTYEAFKKNEWKECEMRIEIGDSSEISIYRDRLLKIKAQVEEAKNELDDTCYSTIIDCVKLLDRAYEFHGTELFVLTCVGMLKAGKSTLVSLMAGDKNASPTGFGVDTTMRPVLIVAADENSSNGRIDVWTESDLDTEERGQFGQNRFEQILLNEIKGKRPEEYYELKDENLKEVLCNENRADIILAVVRVPKKDKSILMKSKVAILDTPGLDSPNSIWAMNSKGDNRYKWILDVADMAVFVQSSVSALNGTATEVLSDLKQHEKVTWLVHNEMRGKYWRTPDSLEPEETLQINSAVNVFQKAGFRTEEVSPLKVNLGKAYDATLIGVDEFIPDYQSPERLKEESKIDRFVKKINDFLEKNGERIRHEHCIKLVSERADYLQQAVDKGVSSLRTKISNQETLRRGLREFSDKIKDEVGRFPVEVSTIAVNKQIADDLFQEKFDEREYSKSDIIKTLKGIDDELPKKFKEAITEDFDKVEVSVKEVGVGKDKCSLVEQFVYDKLVEFGEIAKAIECGDDWKNRIKDITTELVTMKTRDELVDLCKANIAKLDLKQKKKDISGSIASAEENPSGATEKDESDKKSDKKNKVKSHRKWGFLKRYYMTGAMDLSASTKKAFQNDEEKWGKDVGNEIKAWLTKDFKDELCRRFNKKISEIVEKEIKRIEGDIKMVSDKIKDLDSLKPEIKELKIKGA